MLLRYLIGDCDSGVLSNFYAVPHAGKPKKDDEVLKFFAESWQMYTFSAKVLNNLFAYLNRHWVPRAREEGRKDVYEIYKLTLVVWRDNLFMPLQTQVPRPPAASRPPTRSRLPPQIVSAHHRILSQVARPVPAWAAPLAPVAPWAPGAMFGATRMRHRHSMTHAFRK